MAMTSLKLFTSNRLEILAKALAEVLETPLASPFEQEVIIVQSKGMERWIATQLAGHHDICANIQFPFPNAFVNDVFRRLLPGDPTDQDFDPEVITWKIMGLLPSLTMRPGFESLKNYLGNNGNLLKRLQLAERIAHTFDQYLTFRPEMILRWEQGTEDHWQAVLWRELAKDAVGRHRAVLGRALFDVLQRPVHGDHGLPERVSVFGISALPRFHMEILAGISRLVQVNFFLMNPCKEYWGDIVSDWEMKRAVDRERSLEKTSETLHLEKGNSLLASMGAMGRAFFDLVHVFDCEDVSLFEDPGEETLLSCLQSDILHLQNRGAEGTEKKGLAAADDCVRIHECHSPMREMEVLNDQLLRMFEQDPSLMPEDVLVMTPDIEMYAPYIEAVFDVPADERRRFPFNLADRSVRKESPVVEAFLSVLELCGSRLQASQVMAVLDLPVVFKRFGLSETDLELVRTWVAETGIRWGIDARSRGKLGLPVLSENTWSAGLDRLLLGYAMPGKDEHLFGSILPYDKVEGGEANILGRFLAFAQRLFSQIALLDEPRPLRAWSTTLLEVIDTFLWADEENGQAIQILRDSVITLGNMEQRASFNESVDITVIKGYLRRRLEREGFGHGFMAGGITFCAMLPMRSIPFKVLCLVGMNGDAYPRESIPLGFDLMAQHPRPGDRSRRHDDRYLFLEAILSAREKLYISYVGQSTQDNSAVPPSVLVSELADYVEQGFEVHGDSVREHMVVRHRLQPFSPAYFRDDEKLFSYSRVDMEAALAGTRPCEGWKPFVSEFLAMPEGASKIFDLDDLCRFFTNPAKHFMNRRFGMYLERRAAILEDAECFFPEGLDKYVLEQTLVERRFAGKSPAGYEAVLKASGKLPHGAVGAILYENISRDVDRFVQKTRPLIAAGPLEPLEVDLPISDFKISGTLLMAGSGRLVQYRYAKVTCKDRLTLWIRHLVLQCLNTDGNAKTSILVGLDKRGGRPDCTAWEFEPVQKSHEHLEKLLKIYRAGLCRPVHFFPESSWTYAQWVLQKNQPEEKALDAARKTWFGDDYHRGESEDPYYQCCFRGTEVHDLEFKSIAVETFKPLLAGQKKVKT